MKTSFRIADYYLFNCEIGFSNERKAKAYQMPISSHISLANVFFFVLLFIHFIESENNRHFFLLYSKIIHQILFNIFVLFEFKEKKEFVFS